MVSLSKPFVVSLSNHEQPFDKLRPNGRCYPETPFGLNMLTNELIAKIRRIEITTRKLVNDTFAGEYHSVFKGRGMEFNEVRQYHPGDDVRTIDWNVTARTGEPHIKSYSEERELTVMLVVDASRSGEFGTKNRFKRELAAELAAVMSFAATTNNDKVGLLVFTDRVELLIPPRKGRSHVLRMVRDLLVFQPEGTGTDIRVALDTVNLLLKRRSIVFVISDFLTDPESYRRALYATSRRHDVVAFDIDDPLEREIADVGIIALEDAETGMLRWVDTGSRAWRRMFSGRVANFVESKKEVFNAAGVDRINVMTDKDYVAEVATFFKNRMRRLSQGV